MKKFLLLLTGFVLSANVMAQLNNKLYTTNRNSTDLIIYDTTGFTVDFTRPLTGAGITKALGITSDPSMAEMYILFEDGTGELTRRLGTVDTLSGTVTDIALVGNLQYIAYSIGDSKLYGTYGNLGSNSGIVEIDPTTGALTDVVVRTSDWGSCLVYNVFDSKLYNFSGDNGTFTYDFPTMIETDLGISTPEEMTGAAVVNDSIIFVFGRNNPLYSFNTNTNTYSNLQTLSGFTLTNGLHGMTFGMNGFAMIVTGDRTFCTNTPSVLSVTETGTNYQWLLDGVAITGATNPTHTPVTTGVYSCDLDGKITVNSTLITVNQSPVASFTASENVGCA